MTVRILTDSTCDLPAEIINRLGIYVIPMYIHVGNHAYLDGIDISREEFYRKLPTFSHHPTTAAPSTAKFHAMYDALASEGADEILSIHISATLSGVMSVAETAAKETTSAKVTVLDSHQLSLGTGFLVQKAAELAQQGLSVKEILPVLEDQIKRTYVAAGLDTLKYLRLSGRMNGAVSRIGDLIQIKPILKMYDGVSGVERVRTRHRTIDRLVEMIKSRSPLERIAFLHSGGLASIQTIQNEVRQLIPGKEEWLGIINPVLGAHIGPNVAGFACITQK